MQAPAVLHWPQDAAEVGQALQQGRTVVLCVAQPPGTDRPAARANVRTVLQAALGDWLGCPPSAVQLQSAPGTPLRLHHPTYHASLSISHEEGLSLAAVAPRCAVGVDLLATTALPEASECLQLARDYLGPDVVQQLIRQPPAECATAFAHVWTTQEARLKCAGLELCEWTPELEEHMRGQEVYVLSLPAPYCGALAWAPTPISKK